MASARAASWLLTRTAGWSRSAAACAQVHVSEYRGHRVAVDAYCWLHRGVYSCSEEVCEGQATDRRVPEPGERCSRGAAPF